MINRTLEEQRKFWRDKAEVYRRRKGTLRRPPSALGEAYTIPKKWNCSRCGIRKDMWRRANKESFYYIAICRKCHLEGYSKWAKMPSNRKIRNKSKHEDYVKDPKKFWAKHIHLKFGLSVEQFDSMKEFQDFRCANSYCSAIIPGTRNGVVIEWAIDHNHKTGEVRGLLCLKCNSALGSLDDDPQKIKGLIMYLDDPPAPKVLNGGKNVVIR